MDYNNHNTTLRTNKHLNFEERFYLEKRIVLGDSNTILQFHMHCAVLERLFTQN